MLCVSISRPIAGTCLGKNLDALVCKTSLIRLLRSHFDFQINNNEKYCIEFGTKESVETSLHKSKQINWASNKLHLFGLVQFLVRGFY